MSELDNAVRLMTQTFEEMSIPYVLMGGLVVRIHALPRPTNDVDFTILLKRDRLPEWFAAVEKIGYTVPEQYRHGWVDDVAGMPIVKIRTWLADGLGVDVDVFLAESDFQRSLLERRMAIQMEDRTVWIVTPEDLLLLKLLASRPRDLLDVADLLFVQGQLDEDYMRTWAGRMEITDRLEKALADSPGS